MHDLTKTPHENHVFRNVHYEKRKICHLARCRNIRALNVCDVLQRFSSYGKEDGRARVVGDFFLECAVFPSAVIVNMVRLWVNRDTAFHYLRVHKSVENRFCTRNISQICNAFSILKFPDFFRFIRIRKLKFQSSTQWDRLNFSLFMSKSPLDFVFVPMKGNSTPLTFPCFSTSYKIPRLF